MKTPSTHRNPVVARFGTPLLATGLAIILAGCAGSNPKKEPSHQRGWIGGQYRLVEKPRFFGSAGAIGAFPAQLGREREAALLVTALSSNAPARPAGVREGDLILELDHEPVTRWKDFYRIVDRCAPGSPLPVKVYRNDEALEYHIVVGRETFRYLGTFMVGLPPVLRPLDLWPNPGFSLIALGCQPELDRAELGSVENTYRRNFSPKDFQAVDGEWRAWLVIFQLTKQKTILSQESVPPL